MNEKEFYSSLKKDLENDLNYLKKEKEAEEKKNRLERINDLEKLKIELTKLLRKSEKKQEGKIKELEKKLKIFYYWLFGVALVLLLIMGGTFFYLRSSFRK